MRVSVRNGRIAVGPELREEVERRIYFALGRFGDVIREVTVNLADVHGPRAKTEKKSKLVVFLRPSEQVMAEATDATVIAAVGEEVRRSGRGHRVQPRHGEARAVERRDEHLGLRGSRFNGREKEDRRC